jgi:hypothetical protein
MSYLYDFSREQDLARLFQEDMLLVDSELHFKGNFCDDLVQCRGFGVCKPNFYDNRTFQCNCYWEKKGDFCTWNRSDLLLANEINHLLLNQILG